MPDWPAAQGGGLVPIARAATGTGTVCTAAGSAHTKGSWVEIEDATLEEFHGLWVQVSPEDVGVQSLLVDLGIGGAGAEQVLYGNIFLGHGLASLHGGGFSFWLPLRIPKGSRLSCRCQCSIASAGVAVALNGYRPAPGWPVPLGRATTYGADEASSSGVAVDPGTTANAKGSWVEVVASTSRPIRMLLLDLGADAHLGENYSHQLDLGVGAGGSEVVILADLPSKQSQTGEEQTPGVHGPFPVNIPAGTRIAARLQCSATGATARVLDVVLHGLD